MVRLKLDVQSQGDGWKNFGRSWTRGWGVLKIRQFSRKIFNTNIQGKKMLFTSKFDHFTLKNS